MKAELIPLKELASMLRRHELRSRDSQPEDFVFAGAIGKPLHFRDVQRRGMDEAVQRAKLDQASAHRRCTICGNTYASLLIAQGLDVVFVSRQLGHANPATTLRVYASEFDRVHSAEAASSALSAQFGGLLDGNALETAPGKQPQDEGEEIRLVAPIRNY